METLITIDQTLVAQRAEWLKASNSVEKKTWMKSIDVSLDARLKLMVVSSK